MRYYSTLSLACALLTLVSCGGTNKKETQSAAVTQTTAPPSYFKVDPATASVIVGTIKFTGARPHRERIDMSEDPACVAAHHGPAYDESLVVNPNGTLSNVFVYIKSGLEGKKFEVPSTPITIDQRGCWFTPRVLGIQTGQILHVVNSDPVTHNIHPMAQINREWNHSQGPGDPPLVRKFLHPEVMIPVKCNIHRWMHAYIGVLDHPYFAVTGATGSFEIPNLPPGHYVIEAWQEKLGNQQQDITVAPSSKTNVSFTFKGK
ncbi:MAG: carboxypeptidase regulatory-like domain-containing protein [Bryobacteraceae bacterium]